MLSKRAVIRLTKRLATRLRSEEVRFSRIGAGRMSAIFSKPSQLRKLARRLSDPHGRHAYLVRQVRAFLATQIRALRGDLSQQEFGKKLGKPQSVVSRLENQETNVNIQTLLDIANKLDVGLLVRFIDYPTLLEGANSPSDAAIPTASYSQ